MALPKSACRTVVYAPAAVARVSGARRSASPLPLPEQAHEPPGGAAVAGRPRPARAGLWHYGLLAARVLLAATFISYGWAKLTGGQFGLTPAQAALPVGQLGLFKLSWYLFDQEPFRSFVGVAQVVAGGLLLWHRTALLGALLLLPIAANVLVIDLTYLRALPTLAWRLTYYLGLLFLMLGHYRERLRLAWRALVPGPAGRRAHPGWAYCLLPLAAIGLELLGALPQLGYGLLVRPAATWHSIAGLVRGLLAHLAG